MLVLLLLLHTGFIHRHYGVKVCRHNSSSSSMICLPSVKLIVVIYDKPCVVLMPPAPLAQGLSIYPLTMDSYVGGIKRTWVERQLPPYRIYYLALQTSGSKAYFCVIVNIYILQIHNIHIKPMRWLSLSWVSSMYLFQQ